MSSGATRAALVLFVIGALGVWLVRPIGDACPDIGKLPAGSRSSSAPSFTPPLTRTCTYTTAEGTEARQRYVPIVDWLVLAVVAGVVGLGLGLLGGAGSRREPEREAGSGREPVDPPGWVAAPPAPSAPPAPPVARERAAPPARREPTAPEPSAPARPLDSDANARAAERERERQERAKRRNRGRG